MSDVPSASLQAVARFGRQAIEATSWNVPVEVVLAMPTGSIVAALVRNKVKRGEKPLALAELHVHGGRFFATVHFAGVGSPGLFFPVDIWTRGKPGVTARP
jgi:hypothetical protein